MIDPQKAAELEQQIALNSDLLPRIWKSLYDNLIRQGFEPATALSLLQTYIIATNSGRIYGILPGQDERPKDD